MKKTPEGFRKYRINLCSFQLSVQNKKLTALYLKYGLHFTEFL